MKKKRLIQQTQLAKALYPFFSFAFFLGGFAKKGTGETKEFMTDASQHPRATARTVTATSEQLQAKARALMERAAVLEKNFWCAKDLHETAQRVFGKAVKNAEKAKIDKVDVRVYDPSTGKFKKLNIPPSAAQALFIKQAKTRTTKAKP